MAENTGKSAKPAKKRRPGACIALWIILALLLGMTLFSLLGRDGFQQIDTEQGLELLEGGTVEQAKICLLYTSPSPRD